jgi:O-mycaminosyltylonolide 6-deoxyallosyltransferase
LFAQASCVIHHGGCGTLAAVLRAGIPSILLPQIPPQEIFGRLLEQAHLATGAFEVSTLDPAVLAGAIRRAVQDEEIRRHCRDWQAAMTVERGVPMAADLIESHAKSLPQRPTTRPGRFGRSRDRGGW